MSYYDVGHAPSLELSLEDGGLGPCDTCCVWEHIPTSGLPGLTPVCNDCIWSTEHMASAVSRQVFALRASTS